MKEFYKFIKKLLNIIFYLFMASLLFSTASAQVIPKSFMARRKEGQSNPESYKLPSGYEACEDFRLVTGSPHSAELLFFVEHHSQVCAQARKKCLSQIIKKRSNGVAGKDFKSQILLEDAEKNKIFDCEEMHLSISADTCKGWMPRATHPMSQVPAKVAAYNRLAREFFNPISMLCGKDLNSRKCVAEIKDAFNGSLTTIEKEIAYLMEKMKLAKKKFADTNQLSQEDADNFVVLREEEKLAVLHVMKAILQDMRAKFKETNNAKIIFDSFEVFAKNLTIEAKENNYSVNDLIVKPNQDMLAAITTAIEENTLVFVLAGKAHVLESPLFSDENKNHQQKMAIENLHTELKKMNKEYAVLECDEDYMQIPKESRKLLELESHSIFAHKNGYAVLEDVDEYGNKLSSSECQRSGQCHN